MHVSLVIAQSITLSESDIMTDECYLLYDILRRRVHDMCLPDQYLSIELVAFPLDMVRHIPTDVSYY